MTDGPLKITVEPGFRYVEIDAQTWRNGNSACLLAKDDLTEVCFGGLYAAVTLHDFRVRVMMNPDPGDWHDLQWARRRVFDTIFAPETVGSVINALCVMHHQVGKIEGRQELQRQLAELLGTAHAVRYVTHAAEPGS